MNIYLSYIYENLRKTELTHHFEIDEVTIDTFVVDESISSHWTNIVEKSEINSKKNHVRKWGSLPKGRSPRGKL